VRWAPLVVGLGAAVVCARLGVWQVHRLGERRALNARLEARLAEPTLDVESGVSGRAADSLAYRRATARGVFAFGDQVIEGGRSYQGAPGVHVLTPLRFADGTGVLVVRGWTYSPDARTVNVAALSEPESTTAVGVLVPPSGWGGVVPESLPVGYPLLPVLLRRTEPSAGVPPALVPVPLPPLDNGPHLSYAVQWFSFATIAMVGGIILARREPSPPRPASPAAH
jgi:surfeit locus 1 family protein